MATSRSFYFPHQYCCSNLHRNGQHFRHLDLARLVAGLEPVNSYNEGSRVEEEGAGRPETRAFKVLSSPCLLHCPQSLSRRLSEADRVIRLPGRA